MSGGSISNSDRLGNFLTGDIIEETEAKMEFGARIKVFYGNIWVTGKAGALGNITGMARVVEFGGRIG